MFQWKAGDKKKINSSTRSLKIDCRRIGEKSKRVVEAGRHVPTGLKQDGPSWIPGNPLR